MELETVNSSSAEKKSGVIRYFAFENSEDGFIGRVNIEFIDDVKSFLETYTDGTKSIQVVYCSKDEELEAKCLFNL